VTLIGSLFFFDRGLASNKLNPMDLKQDVKDVLVFTSNRDGQFEIYRTDSDGRGLARLTFSTGDNMEPVWSYDGEHIVFTSTRDGNKEIYTMNPDGSQQTNITNNAADDYSPVWSPKEDSIAFVSEREDSDFGDGEIFIVKSDGTSPINISQSPTSTERSPKWSPDGQRLAFESDRKSKPGIYIVQVDGTNLTFLAPGSTPSWSADGKQLAFEAVEEDLSQWDIYKINADGSDLINLTHDSASDTFPVWSPNGTYIAFKSQFGKDGDGLYIMTSDGNSVELIYEIPSDLKIFIPWIWSPDSNMMAFSIGYDISNPFGEILLIDLKKTERFHLTFTTTVLNLQPSWQKTSNELPFPTVTPVSLFPTTEAFEQTPEQAFVSTPQPTLKSRSSDARNYFYIIGCTLICMSSTLTLIMFLWLARRRGYL